MCFLRLTCDWTDPQKLHTDQFNEKKLTAAVISIQRQNVGKEVVQSMGGMRLMSPSAIWEVKDDNPNDSRDYARHPVLFPAQKGSPIPKYYREIVEDKEGVCHYRPSLCRGVIAEYHPPCDRKDETENSHSRCANDYPRTDRMHSK